jgi:hypothetical protein
MAKKSKARKRLRRYVRALEARIASLRAELVRALKDGRCRFNCRTEKEAFMAGFIRGRSCDADTFWEEVKAEEDAYKQWIKER